MRSDASLAAWRALLAACVWGEPAAYDAEALDGLPDVFVEVPGVLAAYTDAESATGAPVTDEGLEPLSGLLDTLVEAPGVLDTYADEAPGALDTCTVDVPGVLDTYGAVESAGGEPADGELEPTGGGLATFGGPELTDGGLTTGGGLELMVVGWLVAGGLSAADGVAADARLGSGADVAAFAANGLTTCIAKINGRHTARTYRRDRPTRPRRTSIARRRLLKILRSAMGRSFPRRKPLRSPPNHERRSRRPERPAGPFLETETQYIGHCAGVETRL